MIAKQKSPSFQFYVRDWLCSLTVQRMSGEEVKAYIFLLCNSWLNEPRATLPNDDYELAAMARVSPEEWHRIKPGVMRGFVIKDNLWINERLSQVSEQQQKNFDNGLKGGNPAFLKGKRNPYYKKR